MFYSLLTAPSEHCHDLPSAVRDLATRSIVHQPYWVTYYQPGHVMAELICNSRLFWMKTIYLSRSDVTPLFLLPGDIGDSGRNALTDISRCLPSDDRVHGIPCFDNGDDACSGGRFWMPRPALSGAQVVPSHPCRARVAPLGPDTHRHKFVPARARMGCRSQAGW